MEYRALSQYRPELMGFAMLWVMLFHSFDLTVHSQTLENLKLTGFGGVDIFILLSCVGLTMSLHRREQDWVSFLGRRARRLLPAYFVVMVPYTLYLILDQGAPWSALVWNSTLLYYWVHCPGAFNWYVCGAMCFYALTPPALAWLRRQRARGRMIPAGCAAMAAALALCQLLAREGYYYVLDVFYRIPTFLLGLMLGIFITEERRLSKGEALFWGICALLGVGYFQLSTAAMDKLWTPPVLMPLVHMFLLTTVPTCLLLVLAFRHLPLGWLRSFLRLVGENSLEIYLLNVSIFSQFELLRQYVSFGPTNRLYFLLSYGANIALGVLLHKLVEGARALYQRRTARPVRP